MVVIRDARIGALRSFAPLPGLTTPEEILADALPMLDPPSRLSVTEAAERYINVQVQGAWQGFDRSVTPYMVEPSDVTQSRLFKVVAFMGPSQSGKTMMLQTVSLHAVTCDQNPTLIVHMSRPERDKWVEEKLNQLICNSPEVYSRLGRGRDDDTFSRKRFRGMRLLIGYPTPQVLSGGTYKTVLLTDLDHMPLVLGGKDNPEGAPVRMAVQRIKSYLSRGCVLAESSPAYPVTDPGWQPDPAAPHALPPVKGGIARLYNDGTRARLYWECPDCGGEFEPRFDRLRYDDSLDPGTAGAGAEMECPHCGTLIAHRHKMELNRAILKGRGGWRHEGPEGQLLALGDAGMKRTDIASYALNGAAATFASWRNLVAQYETARRQADLLGDETDLATTFYTEIGLPYCPRKAGAEDEIGTDFLRAHARDTPRGVAPAWTRFVTVSVDVQGTYFAVQVTAWSETGTAQIIDRFELSAPPDGAERVLDPATLIGDWSVLLPLGRRVWPVEGTDYGLRALALAIDYQGRPGVSDNAEAFWRARRKGAGPGRWFITRGHGGFHHGSRIWYASPERKSGGGKGRNIKLLNMATDRLKDTVFAMLGRVGTGEGALFAGRWMTEAQIAELVAEERLSKGWDKKPGQVRNETLDLSVQARALAEQKGLLRLDPAALPDWALGGRENPNAVALATANRTAPAAGSAPDDATDNTPDGTSAPEAPAPRPGQPAPRRINFLKR